MAETSEAAPQQQSGGFWAEVESLKFPEKKKVAAIPKVGAAAPSSDKIPLPDGKPTIITFLRHCGCPCKLNLTTIYYSHPTMKYAYTMVSLAQR